MKTAKSEWPEFWDAELERLASNAVDLFDDDAVSDAIERTFLRCRLAGKGLVSFEAMKDALKAELRRMVMPQ